MMVVSHALMRCCSFLFSLLLQVSSRDCAQTQSVCSFSPAALDATGTVVPTDLWMHGSAAARNLASQGCDPLSTGYDVEARGMRLNQQMI